MVDLFNSISQYDVISFDVFDTLLLRSCLDPADLFADIERRSGKVGFAQKRVWADHESYARALREGRHATLADAYSLMSDEFRGLMGEELETERRCLTANQELLKVWEEAGRLGKKRVIVSDMYLPLDFIASVLHEQGFLDWDGFYLSCARNARKTDGSLYKIMLEEQGVDPGQALHIGDNAESDVRQAQLCGLQAFHYPKVLERFVNEHPLVRTFLRRRRDFDSRRLVAAMAVAAHNLERREEGLSEWGRIGALVGGVMARAYVSFLVDQARALGIKRVLFVARDGYVLKPVFDGIAPEIKTDYVYAPRLLLSGSSDGAMMEFLRYVKRLTVDEEPVAVVDSVSMNFSAQRLWSDALGRPVFDFSFVAEKPMSNGCCYLYAPSQSLWWLNLCEVMFTAPTPPIRAVRDGRPVYLGDIRSEVKRQLDIAPFVVEAEISVAKFLSRVGVEVEPAALLDYLDAFRENCPYRDVVLLSSLRNGEDPAHTRFLPVFSRKVSPWKWHFRYGIPYKLEWCEREGTRRRRVSLAFGLIPFRNRVEDL